MKIAARLLLGLFSICALAGGAAGAVYYFLSTSHEHRRLELVGGMVADQIFGRIEARMREHREPLAQDAFGDRQLPRPVQRVFLVNTTGVVRVTSDAALRGRTLARRDPGCRECHRAEPRSSVTLNGILRCARPLSAEASCRGCHKAAGEYLGCLVVDLDLASYRKDIFSEIGAGLALLLVTFLAIGWVTLALARRWITRRLDALDAVMHRFEDGDDAARAAVSGADEISRVESGFNRMAGALVGRQLEKDVLLEQVRTANAELQRSEERVTHSYDVQRVLNDLLRCSLGDQPLDAVLQRGLDLLLGIPWLTVETKGCVFVAEGEVLVMRARSGLSPELVEICQRVDFGHCLCGRAAAGRRLVHVDHVGDDHDNRHEGMLPHGHYCVPILSGQEVVGVLNLYLSPGHVATIEEVTFLTAVANTLAGVITRRRAEERLQGLFQVLSQSHKEWQSTFDGITDMIFIVDGTGRFLKVNKAYAAYFGAHPRDLVGRDFREYDIGGAGPAAGGAPDEAAPADGTATQEFLDPRTGRVFRVSHFRYASTGGDIDRFVGLAEDVTVERERAQRLTLNERLAALGQMASGIAHEINNPLASIAGCAEALLGRIERSRFDPALFREYLGIVHEEVFRCKKITTAMLSFVRQGSYEPAAVAPDEALGRALDLVGFQGRLRSVTVVRDLPAGLPAVLASEGELRQVLLIVLSNALDAMNDRGELRCGLSAGDGAVTFTLADTGPGIPEGLMSNIFTPFLTTKAARGGTGLGLSIAKRIVENFGGTIAIDSVAGQGTTVRITLPAAPVSAKP